MTRPAPETIPVVAVDGPAAAGKTTTSLILAKRYGLRYLESGRVYRIIAFMALRAGVPLDDENALISLYHNEFDAPRTKHALLAGDTDHEHFLRGPEVTRAVSTVASMPTLRTEITELIRRYARDQGGSLVEGRDIGTTVFPNAAVKFYLTADPEVRARRRVADEPGGNYRDVLAEIVRRDHADTTRKVSPLLPADDSLVIDTSRLTVSQVVDRMAAKVTPVFKRFGHA